MVRGKIRKAAYAQGLYRHSADERRELARRAVAACAALLGDKPFLFGDEPRGADATLGAFAVSGLPAFQQRGARRDRKQSRNLVAYAQADRSALFSRRKMRKGPPSMAALSYESR